MQKLKLKRAKYEKTHWASFFEHLSLNEGSIHNALEMIDTVETAPSALLY